MSVYMIATIRRSKNDIEALRLYDTESRKTSDIPIVDVCNAMMRNIHIENLIINNGELKGVNGSIDRYSIIPYGDIKPFNRPLVILGKDSDTECYLAVDYSGKQYEIGRAHISQLNNPQIGVANGKIVDGRIFAIEGNYPHYTSSISHRDREVPKTYNFSDRDKTVFKSIIGVVAKTLLKSTYIAVSKPQNLSNDMSLHGKIPFGIKGRAQQNPPSIDIYLGYPREVSELAKTRISSQPGLYVYIKNELIYSDLSLLSYIKTNTLTREYLDKTLRSIVACCNKYIREKL